MSRLLFILLRSVCRFHFSFFSPQTSSFIRQFLDLREGQWLPNLMRTQKNKTLPWDINIVRALKLRTEQKNIDASKLDWISVRKQRAVFAYQYSAENTRSAFQRVSESSKFGFNVAWTKSVRDNRWFKKSWAENLFMLPSFANSYERGGLPSIRIKLNLDCRDRRSTLIYCSSEYLAQTAQFSTSAQHSDWLNVGLGKFLELSHRCGIIKTVWGRLRLG